MGNWTERSAHLAHLIQSGYLVGWSASHPEESLPPPSLRPVGLLAVLDGGCDVEAAGSVAGNMGLSWLAWDCVGGLSMESYRMGAAAVLPEEITPADLVQAVEMFLNGAEATGGLVNVAETRTYEPGETIAVGADSVVAVRAGVVATRVLHPGGAQVLLGMFGPGEVLLAHRPDPCYAELVAQTAVEVSVHPWRDVAVTWEYAYQAWRSQTYLAAWASVQTRARVDQRIVGILMILADRFGRGAEAGWTKIDLRLTHQQLADAACTTRPTVSRVLRELLLMGVVRFDGVGDFRRVYLKLQMAREIMAS